jgi:hypothetical protein
MCHAAKYMFKVVHLDKYTSLNILQSYQDAIPTAYDNHNNDKNFAFGFVCMCMVRGLLGKVKHSALTQGSGFDVVY